MKTSQVFWGCLGTTMGTVLIGVQPVLGLTWTLTGDATILPPSPFASFQPNCCSGSFDFDGTTYSNVSLTAFGIETFSVITGTGLSASSTSNSMATTVNVMFFSSLSTALPGASITFTGNGTTALFGGADFTVSGTVTTPATPVPYEFESATGLAILAGGYGLRRWRQQMKSQRSQADKADLSLNSEIPPAPQNPNPIPSESVEENQKDLVKSI